MPMSMHSARLAVLAACLLVPAIAAAQGGAGSAGTAGSVEGVATSAEDGAPIPFALLRLLPTAPRPDTLRQGTGARGGYRFTGVPAGEYRLQLLRIGRQPVLSPVLQVRAGEPLRHDLRAATQAVQLATVRVRANATCLTTPQLAEEPRLAALWNEVRNGVEIRRAFEHRHRFTRIMRQDILIDRVVGRSGRQTRADTLVSEPDSVDVRDARRAARNRERGYQDGNLLVLPYEKELLSDEFMRAHCMETEVAQAEGLLGIRFRPVQRREGTDVRGTIWVEEGSYQIRRLDVEHLRGGDAFSWMHLDYADVLVGGSAIRLPTGGDLKADLGLAATIMNVRGGTARLAYTYRDVAEVPAR